MMQLRYVPMGDMQDDKSLRQEGRFYICLPKVCVYTLLTLTCRVYCGADRQFACKAELFPLSYLPRFLILPSLLLPHKDCGNL